MPHFFAYQASSAEGHMINEHERKTVGGEARKKAALDLASRGFFVLPVDDRKVPYGHLTPCGFKNSTRDPAVIKDWWDAEPLANVAIACGNDYALFVIDVDVKNGATGKESLRKLWTAPRSLTLVAKTPSGGLHVYFKHPQVPLRAMHPEFPGIDFKGAKGGGYVLAPPSELPNGAYAWVNDGTPLGTLPGYMIAQLQSAQSTGIPGQLPTALRGLAFEPLVASTRASVPQGQRHNTLVRLAGSLRRSGCTTGAVEAALLTQNTAVCTPPLPDVEVRQIAKSSASWQQGGSSASTSQPITLIAPSRDLLCNPPPEQRFTWNPWLPLGSVALLVGEGGVGKTHLLLRIAAHVAAGKPLFNQQVMHGHAVYFGLEDPPAVLHRRLHALNLSMCQQFGQQITEMLIGNLRFASLLGQQIHLVEMQGGSVVQTATADKLSDLIGHAQLVVIDPMSRMHGCEENSNSVTTALINCCERVAATTGAAELLGHHTGKAAAQNRTTGQYAARGGSGLVDAARSALRLIVADREDAKGFDLDVAAVQRGEYLRLIHAKSNYAKHAAPIWLRKSHTGELEHVEPQLLCPDSRDKLLQRLKLWCLSNSGEAVSQDLVRRQYKSIFGERVTRDQAQTVLRRAIEDNELVEVGGSKNPSGHRYRFTSSASAGDTVSNRLPAVPAVIPAEDCGGYRAGGGRGKSGGGEKTRRGLSPYRRPRVSNKQRVPGKAGRLQEANVYTPPRNSPLELGLNDSTSTTPLTKCAKAASTASEQSRYSAPVSTHGEVKQSYTASPPARPPLLSSQPVLGSRGAP
jgi:hypothetical protein